MKTKTIVFLLSLFVLLGCTPQELPPQVNHLDSITPEISMESTAPDSGNSGRDIELDDTLTESEYRVAYEGDDAFLFRNNEKILETPLLDWLGGEEKFDSELWWGVDIWFQREQDNKTMLYLRTMRECGGCVWHERDYISIDNETREISRGKIPSIGDQERFPGLGFEFIFTNDKHKAAAVYSALLSEAVTEGQSIYVFDFEAETVEKFMDVPSGQLVLNRVGHGALCLVSEQALYWNERTDELIINPVDAEDVDADDCYLGNTR